VRKRNSSGHVLKSAARDGEREGPAGGSSAGIGETVGAVMPKRLGQRYDEIAAPAALP